MRLIHENTGAEVRIGDVCETSDGEQVQVSYFRPPHKPSSSGKISVRFVGTDKTAEYYVGVIGCKWIEREDRGEAITV